MRRDVAPPYVPARASATTGFAAPRELLARPSGQRKGNGQLRKNGSPGNLPHTSPPLAVQAVSDCGARRARSQAGRRAVTGARARQWCAAGRCAVRTRRGPPPSRVSDCCRGESLVRRAAGRVWDRSKMRRVRYGSCPIRRGIYCHARAGLLSGAGPTRFSSFARPDRVQ
jgi:hypothetical protein